MYIKKWLSISFINLLIVALLGWIMRYKIIFSLPGLNQKYLQHAHSHFALSGWITQVLMILIAYSISIDFNKAHFKKYRAILWGNLLTAYGMLFSFPFQGYGAVSIGFSTLAIFVSYWFAFKIWKDIAKLPHRPAYNWYKAATLFAVIGSIGTFYMAYLMAIHDTHVDRHLSTVYFYLHFQYNGFYIFACFGLLIKELNRIGWRPKYLPVFFWVYALACVPAYFLSALWLPIPLWVYVLVVLSALGQLAGGLWFLSSLRKTWFKSLTRQVPKVGVWLFYLSAMAYTIKIFLQVGSTIPALNTWAYGFRPIVIGYLHLVFLGVITLFMIAYIIRGNFIPVNRFFKQGIILFVIGIILNELALMVQGVTAIQYQMVPYVNEALIVITTLMLIGVLCMNVGILRAKN